MKKTRFEQHSLSELSNGTFLWLKPGALGSVLCGTESSRQVLIKRDQGGNRQANFLICPCGSVCPPKISSTGSFSSWWQDVIEEPLILKATSKILNSVNSVEFLFYRFLFVFYTGGSPTPILITNVFFLFFITFTSPPSPYKFVKLAKN